MKSPDQEIKVIDISSDASSHRASTQVGCLSRFCGMIGMIVGTTLAIWLNWGTMGYILASVIGGGIGGAIGALIGNKMK